MDEKRSHFLLLGAKQLSLPNDVESVFAMHS